jgi:hypothetical protein
MQMTLNKIMILCSIISTFSTAAITINPAMAKNHAADEAKQQAKAAADNSRAQQEVLKGHPGAAGRAAKKAAEAERKAAKDQRKLQRRGY